MLELDTWSGVPGMCAIHWNGRIKASFPIENMFLEQTIVEWFPNSGLTFIFKGTSSTYPDILSWLNGLGYIYDTYDTISGI